MPDAQDTNQDNPQAQISTPIVLGALEIDLTLGAVHFAGIWIDLTATEYKLLAHLAQNLGRVVPVDELLEKVWGSAAGGTKQQVKNCIWRLRQKIEPDCDKPFYIIAARGRGYYMPAQIDSAP